MNFSHLRVFDCISYVHIDSPEMSKLDVKSKRCALLDMALMNLATDFGILKIGKSSEVGMSSLMRKQYTRIIHLQNLPT